MKNILGLDLGSSSIGWAVIRENSEERELVAMGSRVVSLTAAELSSFTQGNGVSIIHRGLKKGLNVKDMTGINCVAHC